MQVLVKLSQLVPQFQIKKLIKAKMFNTATSFGAMLLENQFDQLDFKDYAHLQFQRGYYMFRTRLNYWAAAKVFTQWALPTEQLILLFAEMYPQHYVDDLTQMFPELQ